MASVASVYAKALFETAQEKGQLEAVRADLRAFNETTQTNPALKLILSGAGVNPNGRKAVLDGIVAGMELKGVVKSLLGLLAGKGRLGALPEIARELEKLVEAGQGIVSGQVRSAVELSQDELMVLSAALAKRVGAKVRLSQSVDPTLLGGMVATVSGQTFDASLKSQLERFKNELI